MLKGKIKYAGDPMSLEHLLEILRQDNSGWALTGGKLKVSWNKELEPITFAYFDSKWLTIRTGTPESICETFTAMTEVRRVGLNEIRIYGMYLMPYQNSNTVGGGIRMEETECMTLKLEHLPSKKLVEDERRREANEARKRYEKAEAERLQAKKVQRSRAERKLQDSFSSSLVFEFDANGLTIVEATGHGKLVIKRRESDGEVMINGYKLSDYTFKSDGRLQ